MVRSRFSDSVVPSVIKVSVLGRRTAEINALGNRTTTIYNSLGQTSALVDARANRHSFTYVSVRRIHSCQVL